MARHRNTDWSLPDPIGTYDQAQTAVLMDIREELQKLNSHLRCPNFVSIPKELRAIKRNTTRQRKKPNVKT